MKEFFQLVILEDDLDFAISLMNHINNTHANIVVSNIFSDGSKGLDFIKKTDPQIILLDLKLIGKNGIEVIKELEDCSGKVIVISGVADMIYEALKLEKVIFKILTKPLDFDRLDELLAQLSNSKDLLIRNFIKEQLQKYDLKTANTSVNYLKDSIFLAIKYPNLLKNMEKNLYGKVAEFYTEVSVENIKWAIQKLITTYIKQEDIATPKLFISHIVDNYYEEEKTVS